MKQKLTTLALLLLAVASGKAQQHKPSNNLDAFVGRWESRTSNEHFILVLKKGVCKLDGSTFDCLVGGYQYEKDGKVVAGYLDSIPSEITEENLTAVKVWAYSLVHSGKPGNALAATLVFVDDGKGQKFSGKNSRLSVFTNTMIDWVIEEGEQPYASNTGKKKRSPNGFSVPTTLLLSKKKEMEYKHRPEIDKYVGTWEYKTENETFILVVKKGKVDMLSYSGDQALGGYKLVKNGKLLGDYTQGITDVMTEAIIETPAEPKLKGNESCDEDYFDGCALKFIFWDVGYGRATLHGYFKLLSPTTAHYNVWIPEIHSAFNPSGTIKERSVPTDIVMTRIE